MEEMTIEKKSNEVTSYECKIKLLNELKTGLCEYLGVAGLQHGVPSTSNARKVNLRGVVFGKLREIGALYRALSAEKIRALDLQPFGEWKTALLMSNRDINRLVHTWLPVGHDARLKKLARAIVDDHDTPHTNYRDFVRTLANRHGVGIGPMQQPVTYKTLLFRNSLVLRWLVQMLEDGFHRDVVDQDTCCNMIRWMLDSSSMKLPERILERERLLPDELKAGR